MIFYACFFLRLGSGALSASRSGILFAEPFCPQQFPLILLHAPFITRRAWVVFINSLTFGLSLALPLCLCCPKKFSKGSWHRRFLQKTFTSGMVVKMYCTNSIKDLTGRKNIIAYSIMRIIFSITCYFQTKPSLLTQKHHLLLCLCIPCSFHDRGFPSIKVW